MEVEGRRIEIRGTVQGVGFRPWVYRAACEQGIAGRVRNDCSGVTIDAFGPGQALDRFVDQLRAGSPPAASIEALHWQAIAPEPIPEFSIVSSENSGAVQPSIAPDLATCPSCVAEIFDTSGRRHRYPFTNCTHCGPRFSIARDVPYDRVTTTMASFAMCPSCEREYQSVLDRRFHAQPNACPVCGPQLRAVTSWGELPVPDPIRAAAQALREGSIVAVKGIGGFHLACDAGSDAAIEELRRRKRRDHKPFAVMVRDLSAAEELADLAAAERRLLGSSERPIVLVSRREGTALAEALAPANPLVGLVLPYTPLHHLLLAETNRPLVMTSGNLSEEPIVHRDEEALAQLGDVADLFLIHDREIAARCDDSVVRMIAGAPVVLRRARGHVPRAVRVREGFERPVLACGGDLKNACCIGAGDAAWFGPHVGDLENVDTFRSFEDAVERMERFLQVRPEIVAHDLHPDFFSTAYARARPETIRVGVQHHHAHVASVMAEHGLEGPVLGVAYDGTGYGTDGTAWGGEFLIAGLEGFERVATFRPLPLAGGDLAIHQVWRLAAALLDDAFGGDPPLAALPLFHTVPDRSLRLVRQMARRGLNSPFAHGVGRYFDAMGALFLERAESHHEGQIAMAWNFAADPEETGSYPFVIHADSSPWKVDLRPMVRRAVADFLEGSSSARISARFHATLAQATAEVVSHIVELRGPLPVVLTGGCFQNDLLARRVLERLVPRFAVYRNQEVPPGDGGIALGQALVADALSKIEGASGRRNIPEQKLALTE